MIEVDDGAEVVDAVIEFSDSLCRLGFDRNVSMEVPKRLFLVLVDYVRQRGMSANQEDIYLGPSRDDIANGIRLQMHSGPWIVRMQESERVELLAKIDRNNHD